MRKVVFILSFALITLHASLGVCQTFNVNLSPKHAAKINQAKTGQAKLKQYHKFFSRDSTRQLRQLNRKLKRQDDSLARVNRKQERARRRAEKKGVPLPIDTLAMLEQYAALLPKDTSVAELEGKTGALAAKVAETKLTPEQESEVAELRNKYGETSPQVQQYMGALKKSDSSARKDLRLKALQEAKKKSIESLPPGQRKQFEQIEKQYGPYSKELNGYVGFLQDSVKLADTLKVMAMQRAEMAAQNLVQEKLMSGGEMGQLTEMQGQIDEMKNTPDQYKQKLDDLQDPEKLKAAAQEKAKAEALDKLAAQSDKVQGVLDRMNKLKGKYGSLLNSNDLSSGVKAKSLEGRPLRERWVLGGNFNIASTAPLMVDLSPQFGYRIDKMFQVGVSGIYRATFVDTVRLSNSISPQRYGYSTFASYSLILNFFAYGEWERTASLVKSGTGDKTHLQWMNALLVGVGRKFRIHPKVNGSLLLLWNPLHENGKTPYHDAFVVKTGIHLSELGMVKK